jgi:hypothetical protein
MLEKVNQDYKTKGQVKRRILGVGGAKLERAVYLVVYLIALGSTLPAYAGKPSSHQTTQEQPLAPAAAPPSENSNNSDTTPQTSGNTSAQQGGTGLGTLAVGGGTAILGIGTAAYVSKKYLDSRWPKDTEGQPGVRTQNNVAALNQTAALEDRTHYWTHDPGGEIITSEEMVAALSKGKLYGWRIQELVKELEKIQPMDTSMSEEDKKQFDRSKANILEYVQDSEKLKQYDADAHQSLAFFMRKAQLSVDHRVNCKRLEHHLQQLQNAQFEHSHKVHHTQEARA